MMLPTINKDRLTADFLSLTTGSSESLDERRAADLLAEKLKMIGFDVLWTDYLRPLLQEYVRGLYDEDGIMMRFAKAYGYIVSDEGVVDETIQD